MSESTFKKEYLSAQKSLDRQKKINLLVKIFTLGSFNTDKRVAEFQVLFSERKNNLDKYNELCERQSALEKSEPVSELIDVRIGDGMDSDIKVIGGEDYGKDWEIIRDVILSRDYHQCQDSDGYCSGPLQVHHVIPLTKGGTNDSHNLITLCLYHHSMKHEHLKRSL